MGKQTSTTDYRSYEQRLEQLAKILKISLDTVFQVMIANLEQQVGESKEEPYSYEDDPWVNLNIEEIACDTGKGYLAINQDNYLYGTKKRDMKDLRSAQTRNGV